jgi:hypothetical protein
LRALLKSYSFLIVHLLSIYGQQAAVAWQVVDGVFHTIKGTPA